MANEISRGSSLGLDYKISSLTGTVMETQTRSETEVTGNIRGGGGYLSKGSGRISSVKGKIESETTRFQNLFLLDEEGKEHSIELNNFLIPCRAEQKLTLFSATTDSRSKGLFFSAYNHNTSEHYENDSALSDDAFPGKLYFSLLGIVALVYYLDNVFNAGHGFIYALFNTLITSILLALILWLPAHFIAGARIATITGDTEYKKFLSQIK